MGAHLWDACGHWTSDATRGNGVELMSIFKRKNPSGKTVWYYQFSLPGATRKQRNRVFGHGFATKGEATDAEAARRIEEQRKRDLAKAGAGVNVSLPTTLSMLLHEFFVQHVHERLAPKTVERYHEQVAYLEPELLAMPLKEITSLHLNREWTRLLKCGGHTRNTKTPRPMSAKTVRNIAGVVSSAFARAIKWGLIDTNPATNSEPPRVKKHLAIALTTAQQDTVLESASGPWCMRTYLQVDAATGCRRGELLALRWSDLVDGCATIARSLTQTRKGLEFKGTKTEKPRLVALPESAIASLAAHRQQQDDFRRQFGPDYRADLDLVFANPDGTPLKPDSISASVSALFKRLKIPRPKGAALHLLRHTHTSVLLAEGVPLAAVSARLGHSSVRTTQEIYAHMITGQDEEAARKWEEYQLRNKPAKPEIWKGSVQ
jgi:integrase